MAFTQLTLCDTHLSALEVRFSRRCAIQIDAYLILPYLYITSFSHAKLTRRMAIANVQHQ